MHILNEGEHFHVDYQLTTSRWFQVVNMGTGHNIAQGMTAKTHQDYDHVAGPAEIRLGLDPDQGQELDMDQELSEVIAIFDTFLSTWKVETLSMKLVICVSS